jgi:sugar lactone lactonase YvrE
MEVPGVAMLETLVDGIDFGEGPPWHDGRLWYSDFYQHAVFVVDSLGKRERVVEVPNQPSGLGWLPDGTLLIVSMLEQAILGYREQQAHVHADLSGVATGPANDMVVDGRGNAYVGNFGLDLQRGAAPPGAGDTGPCTPRRKRSPRCRGTDLPERFRRHPRRSHAHRCGNGRHPLQCL